jgi:hypothetical protein
MFFIQYTPAPIFINFFVDPKKGTSLCELHYQLAHVLVKQLDITHALASMGISACAGCQLRTYSPRPTMTLQNCLYLLWFYRDLPLRE